MFKRLAIVVTALVIIQPAIGANAVKRGKNLVEVTVTGIGMNKEEALHDAKRKAVEQGAGSYIYSQSKTKDFALVKDTVLSRSAGFIQEHEVISSRQAVDGSWEVQIRALVSIKGIQDTWGVVQSLLADRGRPKIMVFVRERIGGMDVESSTVQARIENLLLESGFLLVNREQLKAIDMKDLEAAVAENRPAKIQAIAKRFGAQLFITGTASATAGEQKRVSGVPLSPYEAEANVKCYRSDTAQLLSSIPGTPTRGVDRVWRSAAKKALDAQAQQVAPEVRDDVLRFWQDALEGRGEIQLHVAKLSFKQYLTLKKQLQKVDGVESVNTRYHNKTAECSIQSDLRAEALAEKLVGAVENLEITDLSQNVIKADWAE